MYNEDDFADDPEFGNSSNATPSSLEIHRHRVEAARAAARGSGTTTTANHANTLQSNRQQHADPTADYQDEHDDDADFPEDDEEDDETDKPPVQPLYFTHEKPGTNSTRSNSNVVAPQNRAEQQQPIGTATGSNFYHRVNTPQQQQQQTNMVSVGVATDMHLASMDHDLRSRISDLEQQVEALLHREQHLEEILEKEQHTHDAQMSALVREMTARQQELESELEELRSGGGVAGGDANNKSMLHRRRGSSSTPVRTMPQQQQHLQNDGDTTSVTAANPAVEDELRRQVEELNHKLQRSEADRAALEERATRWHNEMTHLQTQLDDSRHQLNRVRDDSDDQIDRLRERLIALEQRSSNSNNNSSAAAVPPGNAANMNNSSGNYISWDDLRALSHALSAAQVQNHQQQNHQQSQQQQAPPPRVPVYGVNNGNHSNSNSYSAPAASNGGDNFQRTGTGTRGTTTADHPLGPSTLATAPPPPERSARRISRTYQQQINTHQHAESEYGGAALPNRGRNSPYGQQRSPEQQQQFDRQPPAGIDAMAGSSGPNTEAKIVRSNFPKIPATPPTATIINTAAGNPSNVLPPVAAGSPQRSPRHHREQMNSSHIGEHLRWMSDPPPEAQVGVQISAAQRSKRARTPFNEHHMPAQHQQDHFTGAVLAINNNGNGNGQQPQPTAMQHQQYQQPQQLQQPQQQQQNYDMLSAAEKLRYVERLEHELMECSLERDRTNDAYGRLESVHLRTQAEIAKRNGLKNKLDDLNKRVHHIRVQLRGMSALHR